MNNSENTRKTEGIVFTPWLRSGPIAIWLLFWFGSLLGYLFAGLEEYVAWCIPHIEGCTSVSKAGRYGTSFVIYKLLLIPAALLLLVYWVDVYRWLQSLLHKSQWLATWMLVFGCCGALFLTFHLVALGLDCEVCRTVRSYGTKGFYVFTFLAQWFLYAKIRTLFPRRLITHGFFLLCIVVTLEILILTVVPVFWENTRAIENGIAWRSTFYLSFAPVLIRTLWTHTDQSLPGDGRSRSRGNS